MTEVPAQAEERTPSPPAVRLGVISYLDVLGWKGISSRYDNPLPRLNRILDTVKERMRGLGDDPQDRVIALSDTIGIFTALDQQRLAADRQREVQRIVDAHGAACGAAVRMSIEHSIPIRGATCLGEYQIDETGSTFFGKGVDEVASWYEQADWIGVHLTPSALFGVDLRALTYWVPYQPPLKTKTNGSTGCVAWENPWFLGKSSREACKVLHDAFFAMGPIYPEFAGKFMNTLEFVKCRLPADE